MLRGAVLGLQDDGRDNGDIPDASSEPVVELAGEEQPQGDQPDGQGPQSPKKQEQRQHLHLMVELLRPQDDIHLVRGPPEPIRRGMGGCVSGEQWCESRGHPVQERLPRPHEPAVSGRHPNG